ncbi:hypothetical protein A1O7_03071 [Cladophialophora yegresii CBS 114405]|uniref:Fungal N-terminal domain-containing protein n=1 Tax=Cladophialophora yegresii CBS 114405 TaxID=1182544 RepID=W9W3V1_9EURO|nr:uncharacterized protein A1O7_03071 [Cladophialophora yegresii CBS 114405]EXJ62633.1 hypothetical protein A1O7_03071 [Cladophialophora yegresii CBS 114405]
MGDLSVVVAALSCPWWGISPSNLVNGFLAAKRVVEALKDENGSEHKAAAALTSLEHELAAVEDLEAFLNTVQDEAGPSMVQYQVLPTSGDIYNEKAKRAYRKLQWAFSGEKDFRESNARITAASDGIHLDAIVISGRRTQAEVAKLEPLISSRVDSVSEQVQASQAESTLGTQQILESISRSHTDLSKLILQMQTAFEKGARRQRREGCEAETTPLTIVKPRSPRLDTLSEVHPSFPSFQRPRRPLCQQIWVLPEQAVTPMLIAALCCLTTRQRIEDTLRGFIDLARPNPASAILILCAMVTFSHMAVRLCPQLSLLGADRVRFDDAFGSSIMLPFSTCEYPAAFSEYLVQGSKGYTWTALIIADTYYLNHD